MPRLTIDNQAVEVPPGATVLETARALGKNIPTLCYREGHPANTSCFVCVVKINGSSRLLPACATVAEEGMVVESDTEEVHGVRRTALELLLSDHLGDCLGPCQAVCPAHVDVPGMLRQIAAGRADQALETFRDASPFPATLGRICHAMCQRACRRGSHDATVAIQALHRWLGEAAVGRGLVPRPARARHQSAPYNGDKRVAIIGAGPAGMAAAYFLQQAGCACVLFEVQPEPGGGLRYGVPEEALPRVVLEAEIAGALGLGVELRTGQTVDAAGFAALRKEYDAVLIAGGEMTPEGAAAWGLPWAKHGLAVEEQAALTGMRGVFAAGSAVSPSRHAARASGEGRVAAEAICRYLAGTAVAPPPPVNTHIGRMDAEEVSRLLCEASAEGAVDPGSAGGDFTAEEAARESRRCLHCDCRGLPDCRLRQYATEYGASPGRFRDGRRRFVLDSSHPAVIFESGKCISCGLCLQIAQQAREPLGLAFVGRGVQMRTEVPFHEALATGLQVAAAECVATCPTGALAWKESREGE